MAARAQKGAVGPPGFSAQNSIFVLPDCLVGLCFRSFLGTEIASQLFVGVLGVFVLILFGLVCLGVEGQCTIYCL